MLTHVMLDGVNVSDIKQPAKPIYVIHVSVDNESDRTVVLDTNGNCTEVPFKSIKTNVNTNLFIYFYIILVFYIVVWF